MAVSEKTISDAFYTYLTADSSFNTAIGGTSSTAGRLYLSLAPRDADFPFVVMTFISGVTFDTMPKDGYSYRIQFAAFEDEGGGPRGCMDILDALRARLHRTRVSPTGYRELAVREDVPLAPFFNEKTWQQSVDYIAEGVAA